MQLRETGVTWQVVGDDVVVLDLDGSVYLKLNGSGRILWERLAEGCTEAELAEALVQRYDIGRARADQDVEEFVANLRRRSLVEP